MDFNQRTMNIAVLILLYSSLVPLEGAFKVTNIQCWSLDKSFSDFEYCFIRAVNRTYNYVSLKVNLYKKPLNSITVTTDLRKKANGYKPFLYNITFDACKFLKTKSNPIARYFFKFIESYSNINHTCPYDHDVIVEKVDTTYANNLVTNVLPVPEGDYAIFITWAANNIPRGRVNSYFSLS